MDLCHERYEWTMLGISITSSHKSLILFVTPLLLVVTLVATRCRCSFCVQHCQCHYLHQPWYNRWISMTDLVTSLKTDGLAGDLDAYTRLSPKLKMGTVEDEFSRKTSLSSPQSQQVVPETEVAGQVKTGLPTIYSAETVTPCQIFPYLEK